MIEGVSRADNRSDKSIHAFRTIREVSEELAVPQHVLRFWESKFKQLRPLKRGGGRRYYRLEDFILLQKIQKLLYKDGYTIKGAQKLIRETDSKKIEHKSSISKVDKKNTPVIGKANSGHQSEINRLITELNTLREMLRGRVVDSL